MDLNSTAQTSLEAAQLALAAGDLVRAQEEAERLREAAPDHPRTLVFLAELARAKGDMSQASAHYAQALDTELDPALTWTVRANQAEVLLAQGDGRGALAHAQVALQLEPEEVDPYLAAARAYLLLNQPNNALQLLDEVLTLDETVVEAHLLRAQLHMERRAYSDAISDYADVIDAEPERLGPYLALAKAAAQIRDYALALNTLEEGWNNVVEDAGPLRDLWADLLLESEEQGERLAEVEALIAHLEQPSLPLLLARAEGRFDNEDVEGALADYEAVLVRDPTHADARNGRMDALLALGRWYEARQLLDALLTSGPTADLYNQRGDLSFEQDALETARADYEQALALEPRHPFASYNLALTLLEMGDPQAALPHLDLAVEAIPDDEERLYTRSLALTRAGLPYLGWLDAERALTIDDSYIEGYLARAEAATALGSDEEALDDLGAALELYPTYGSAIAMLARLLERTGKSEDARARWVEYLDLPEEEQDEETLEEARSKAGVGNAEDGD